MITIGQFDLTVDASGVIEFEMPQGAIVLSAGSRQPRQIPAFLSVWATVDTDRALVQRTFLIAGDDVEITPDEYANGRFVGTVIVANGTQVWHVFDLGEVADRRVLTPPAVRAAQTEQPAGKIPPGMAAGVHADDRPGS